jgi:gliding motility-associated-like protein
VQLIDFLFKTTMKRLQLLLCLLVVLYTAQAQKQNNIWVFGFNAALDFNTNPPTPFRVQMSNMSTADNQGGSAVCDRNTGQLLFYTDGIFTWNRNFNLMPNGNNGKSYAGTNFNAVATVPVLDNPNRYYVFTISPVGRVSVPGWGVYSGSTYSYGVLSYSIVDMTLDNGLGDVVPGQKDIILDSSALAGKMVAIPGAGCNIWLLVRAMNSNSYRAYEITPAGINTTPVISNAGPAINSAATFQGIGVMKASSDYKKLVVTFGQNYTPGAAIYDFDRVTGVVSNPMGLNFDVGTYPICGATFSPDGSKVYFHEICHSGGGCSGVTRVFQFDLSLGSQAAIQASRYQVATIDNAGSGFGSRGGDVHVAPDGKVYIASQSSGAAYVTTGRGGRLYTIDYPNVYGAGSQFQSTPVALVPHVDSGGYGLPVPVVFPTPDTVAYSLRHCHNADSTILRAPGGFFAYQWHDGSTDTSLVVRSTGKYWVRMENYCEVRTDTFLVVISPLTVDLGADLALCGGDTAVLQSASSYTNPQYQWNTGAASPSIKVTQPGVYILKVTQDGCEASDTVEVTVTPALNADLGKDTGICVSQAPLVLRSEQPAGTHYLWSNGLSDSTMEVYRTGRYWLEVSLGNCKSSDTIQVLLVPDPDVFIGNDTVICEQFPLRLGMEVPGARYRWNRGETTSHISVNSTGDYILETNLYGCIVSDTISVTAMPLPEIDLGGDRDICPEQTMVLDGTYGAQSRYRWSTGASSAQIAVSEAGTYWVMVHSEHGCVGGDTVTLRLYPKPQVVLGPDTTVCEETPLILLPRQLNADSLVWSDGSVGDGLSVRYGGSYVVTGINKCGEGSDTIEVKQIFCDIWVPNAFTPNGDGINDILRTLGNTGRLENFGLSVYNRWGQRVFYTRNKQEGWDGTFNGGAAPVGTYVYLLEYTIGNNPYMLKGSIHLVR